ncbi:MAG: hypothetical protein U1E51_26980 [Candidatus Binatia bacterium]|nr:hypothetical protein [Candidatus Binatia bacterium]
MAARKRKVSLTDSWKAKIRASMLMNRLQDHALGKLEMKNTQIKAADIVLRKMVPDLSTTQGPGRDGEHKVTHRVEWVIVDAS